MREAEVAPDEAIPAARLALASYLGVSADMVELEQIEDAEWLDSCLGLGGPAADIPGPELNGAVVFFQRSGGLAGELMTVRIYPDGTVARAGRASAGYASRDSRD